MELHKSKKIESLMPIRRLKDIARQLNSLRKRTNSLIKAASKLSSGVGESFELMAEYKELYKVEIERELGFYRDLLNTELVYLISTVDMPRLIFPFIRGGYSPREKEFMREFFFNIIVYARVTGKSKVSFDQKWRYCDVIKGIYFDSDSEDECETIYNNLKNKDIILEAEDRSGFYLNLKGFQWEDYKE